MPQFSLRSIQVGFILWMRPSLGADPPLDLFFAFDGAVGVVITLVPDEAAAVVVGCESCEVFGFVLGGTGFDVAGHAGIENAGAAGDDVDVVAAVAHDRSVEVLGRFATDLGNVDSAGSGGRNAVRSGGNSWLFQPRNAGPFAHSTRRALLGVRSG